jgi:AcrR family transcriptional regulator
MATRKLATAEPETIDLWQSAKRQVIQQAVVRLMCREGLDNVTMERVANEAGIAKGTLYLHYRDKQELLDAVKESSLAPMVEKMDEVLHGSATPDRKIQLYALRYLDWFDERRDLFRILIYERESVRVHGARYTSDRYRHLVQQVAKVITDGIRKGIFRDVDAHTVATMFVESNFSIVNQRLLTARPAPVEDDAELISSVFLRGIRAGRGAK